MRKEWREEGGRRKEGGRKEEGRGGREGGWKGRGEESREGGREKGGGGGGRSLGRHLDPCTVAGEIEPTGLQPAPGISQRNNPRRP